MSNDLNQCSFIGRLGASPESKHTASGDTVCNFRIAVGWKSKEKEGTEWINVVAFGMLGEICEQYLKKGSQVFVQGRFKTDEYEKNGEKRYAVKIVADRMQMLGSKDAATDATKPTSNPKPAPKSDFSDMQDDVPF